MILWVCLLILFYSQTSFSNPALQATELRFDLQSDNVEIADPKIVEGKGLFYRMNFLPKSEHPKTLSVHCATEPKAWSKCILSIMPKQNGFVKLTLKGVWKEFQKRVVYRQEVYWDAIKIVGSTIENGSFEKFQNNKLLGWLGQGSFVEAKGPSLIAIDGKYVAKTWHDQTLYTNFRVTKNIPVLIQVFGRSVAVAK